MATALDDPEPCPFCGHLGCVMCPPMPDAGNEGGRTAEGRWEMPPSVAMAMFDPGLDAPRARRALHSTRAGMGRVGVLGLPQESKR